MRRITALAMTMIPFACSASREARVHELRPVLAHWVHRSDSFEPDWGDFMFDALSFATPTDGWIVGNRYFLHIVGDRISVTFVRPTRAWMGSLDCTSPDDCWTGGFRVKNEHANGVIWHLRRGRWIPADLSGLVWPDWFVGEVRASPRGEIWATASIELPRDHVLPPAPRRWRRTLLRSDGVTWSEDPTPREGDRHWAFFDACVQPSGESWFVGVDMVDPGHRTRWRCGTATTAGNAWPCRSWPIRIPVWTLCSVSAAIGWLRWDLRGHPMKRVGRGSSSAMTALGSGSSCPRPSDTPTCRPSRRLPTRTCGWH